jgi:redox-sensitive bicupin YhaK (pirin superfamily)
MSANSIVKVPAESLFVSEPDPRMFGNGRNNPDADGWNNGNWLKSRFHFNFAEYHSGRNNFGVLRVMNDDLVQPDRGFGEHPHRDMEIVTFIVDGDLAHKDSTGNKEVLGRGSVQFMTAGKGVYHSEFNASKSRPVRFIQTWITPRTRGLQPNYGSMVGEESAAAARHNQWAHVMSDVDSKVMHTPVQINQDCNMYVTELDPNTSAPTVTIAEGRQAYMLVMEGEIALQSGPSLGRHDAAEIYGPVTRDLVAGSEGAFVIYFEMARSNSRPSILAFSL